MLERRGIDVMALDSDTFGDAESYYERRIYCKQVRRVSADCLMHFNDPSHTALIFVHSVLTPWRGYLARYPEVPIVIIIGDDTDKKWRGARHPNQGANRSLRRARTPALFFHPCQKPSRLNLSDV